MHSIPAAAASAAAPPTPPGRPRLVRTVVAAAALVGMAGAWLAPASAGAGATGEPAASASVRTVAASTPLPDAGPAAGPRAGIKAGSSDGGGDGTESCAQDGTCISWKPASPSKRNAVSGTTKVSSSGGAEQAGYTDDEEATGSPNKLFKLISEASGAVKDVAGAATAVANAAGAGGNAATSIAGAVSAWLPIVGPLLSLIPH